MRKTMAGSAECGCKSITPRFAPPGAADITRPWSENFCRCSFWRECLVVAYLPSLPQMAALMRQQKRKTRTEAHLQGFHKWRGNLGASQVKTIRSSDALPQLILYQP